MSLFYDFLSVSNTFLWNGPLLVLLLGTHCFFTIRLRFVQHTLPKALRSA